jgi:hypothetical protein
MDKVQVKRKQRIMLTIPIVTVTPVGALARLINIKSIIHKKSHNGKKNVLILSAVCMVND